jgi:hypothetical protein
MVSYRLFQLEFDAELGRHVRRLVGEYADEWTARAELRARRQAATAGQPSYEVHPHELEVRHFPRSRSARAGGKSGTRPPASSRKPGAHATDEAPAAPAGPASKAAAAGAAPEPSHEAASGSPPQKPPQVSSDGS